MSFCLYCKCLVPFAFQYRRSDGAHPYHTALYTASSIAVTMAEGMEVEVAPAIRDKKRFEVKKVSRCQQNGKKSVGCGGRCIRINALL